MDKEHLVPDEHVTNEGYGGKVNVSKNGGSFNTSSVLNSLTAGYIAGISGIIVGHPFESIKVWLQTKTENQNKYLKLSHSSPSVRRAENSAKSPTPHHTGSGSTLARKTSALANSKTTAKAMSTLSQQQQQQLPRGAMLSNGVHDLAYNTANKLRALYSGVTGPLLTVGVIQCVTFALYDSVRRVLHDRDTKKCDTVRDATDYILNDSLKNVAIAGSSAGVIVSSFTSPMIKVKIQQQVTGNGYRRAMYETFFRQDTGTMISPRILFRGFGPHFVLETCGRSMYYTTYEVLKRSIMKQRRTNNNSEDGTLITLHERMICAALAGITNWSVFFPLDAIRSRLYAQQQQQQQHSSLQTKNKNNIKTCLEMVRSMYYETSPSGSLKSFYRGFGVTVVRAGPVAAAVLPIYDLSLKWLSSSNS